MRYDSKRVLFKKVAGQRKAFTVFVSMLLLFMCPFQFPPAATVDNYGNVFAFPEQDLSSAKAYSFSGNHATNGWFEQWNSAYGGYGHSQFAQPIGDIDKDGVNEIIVGGYEDIGRARILSYNKNAGTYIEEYSWTYSVPESYYTVPSGACVADLDAHGDLEFVVAWAYSGPIGIYAYRWDGNTLTTLDVYTGVGADHPFDVYACDYDDDGRVEVLVANAPNVNGGGYHLTALGWNNTSNKFVPEAFWKLAGYDGIMECPMVWSGDTDRDGKTEVIACISDGDSATAGTWALNWNAVTKQWQEVLVYDGLIAGGTHYGVAVGDIDRDGTPEIGIGNNVPQYGAGACLFEWDGAAYRKVWDGSWSAEYPTIEAVAIGDADNDGKEEFCFGGGHVHIIGWTKSGYAEESTITGTSGVLSGLNIGDCDTDGLNELKACDILGLGLGKEWIFKHTLQPPDEILIEEVIGTPVHDLIAFRYPTPLSSKDTISPVVPTGMEVPYQQTWFYWICDFPYAMFAHDTRYVFINHETGEYKVQVGRWWPMLNGVELWATPEEFWNRDYWVYSTYAPPHKANIVFEEAHLPAYTIGTNPADDVAGGYSKFANYLTSNGYNVSTINPGTAINSSVLHIADVLVIVAPQDSYSAHEIGTIESWVKGGGGLLLITDWGYFGFQAASIASRFGISLAGDTIHDIDEYVGGETYWPYYHGSNLRPHLVTDGVNRIEMYVSDGITGAPADQIPLIVTDSDETATWDDGYPALQVPVMSAFDGGTAGSGRLVIVMDSNIWDSAYDTEEDGALDFYDSDNEILALNTIDWLARTHESFSRSLTGESNHSAGLVKSSTVTGASSQSVKRALIIDGNGCRYEEMKINAENWYILLKEEFGYSDEEISYLSANATAFQHAEAHVKAISTLENVNKTIKELSRNLTSGDSLSVYIVAHGESENASSDSTFDGVWLLKGTDALTDKELAQLLSQINENVSISVVIQSCYSGVFMDDLCKLPQVKIALTSTDQKSICFLDIDKEWAGLEIPNIVEPNPEDEGCEFSSGLIENLRKLARTYEFNLTNWKLFNESFRCALEKDAGYLNREALRNIAITEKLWGPRGNQCYPDPQIKTKLFEGDLNQDGVVNILDVAIVGAVFNAYLGCPDWNPVADTNCDDIINILDIANVCAKFGEEYY